MSCEANDAPNQWVLKEVANLKYSYVRFTSLITTLQSAFTLEGDASYGSGNHKSFMDPVKNWSPPKIMQPLQEGCVVIGEMLVGRKGAVNQKQWFVIFAGVIGILLVVLCPLWFYPSHPLMPQERSIGYRLITQPPEPLGVVKEDNGRMYYYANQWIVARIDRADLCARIGLIIAITLCGLWILLRLNQTASRKKHWILIILVTVGLLLAAHVRTVSNTH